MVCATGAPKPSVKSLPPMSKIFKKKQSPPSPLSISEQLHRVDCKLESIEENMRIIAKDIADIKKSFKALFEHIGLPPPFESV